MFFKLVWFNGEPCSVTEEVPHSTWNDPREEPSCSDMITDVDWLAITRENYRKLANLFADYR